MAKVKKKTTKKKKPDSENIMQDLQDEIEKRQNKKKSLFDFRMEMIEVEKLVSEEGELDEDAVVRLIKLKAGSIKKMQGLIFGLKRLEEVAKDTDAEVKRLQDLSKFRKMVHGRICNALVKHILFTEPDKKTIDLETYVIKAKKCPPSVNLVEGFDDPFFCDVKAIKNPPQGVIALAVEKKCDLVREPDKTAIKKALIEGEVIDGAELVDDKYRLEVK